MLSYSEIEKTYSSALSKARLLPKPHIGNDTIIVATHDAVPPARILYTACLHAGVTCTIADPTLASLSIIPYRETGGIIAFTLNPRSLRTVNLAETASLLGLEVTVVAGRLHPAVKERLDMLGVRIVETGDPPLLTMSLAATLWTPRLMGAREARVRAEIEDLDSALEYVSRGPASNWAGMRGKATGPPLYSPIAAPGAYYHCQATGCGSPIPLEAAYNRAYNSSIVYLTSVEYHDYRDILVLPGKVNKNLIVKVSTDPVTAGIYSVIAAILVTGKIV